VLRVLREGGCVLLLPCRHLCMCGPCAAAGGAVDGERNEGKRRRPQECPLCGVAVEAAVGVFF